VALIIVTQSEPLKIHCHVIVTQLRETVEKCARKFRSVSLQVKEWKWVNYKLITPEQWSWLLCSVSATPVNKVLPVLQELNWSESRCWLQIF